MKKYLPVYFLSILLYILSVTSLFAALPTEEPLIRVDQFGYLCSAQKIAVIADPQTGYNSGLSFTPGTTTYEVRRSDDQTIAFSGSITTWNGGATHDQSGDKYGGLTFRLLLPLVSIMSMTR